MPSLLDQLRRAVLQGAALASSGIYVGCAHSGSDHANPDAAKPVGAEDAATTAAELKPYPSDRVTCYGPDHGNGPGLYGQCCVRAQCYTPSDPAKCAGDAGADVPGRPTGSGTCACAPSVGLEQTAVGPYAPNPDHMPSSPGSCCYLVATITCDGRPLIVDDVVVVAGVVERSDWAFVV